MRTLKNLVVTSTLIAILAVTVLGGETPTVPCVPGETNSPPCPAQPLTDDSAEPGETLTPPAEPTVDVTDIAETVLWALLLF